MFSLLTNQYSLGFNYRALIEPMIYSGETVITNPHTSPEIYGAFLDSTPTCGMTSSLVTLRDWFGMTNGFLVRFHIFDTAPLTAGEHEIRCEIRDIDGNILIRTYINGVVQPYQVRSAIPIEVLGDPGLSVLNGKVIGGVVGQEINCIFGFKIVPDANQFTYSRTNFNELPFKTVPVGGLEYSNP